MCKNYPLSIQSHVLLTVLAVALVSIPALKAFDDDDDDNGFRFFGRVETIAGGNLGTWTIGGRPVQVTSRTRISLKNGLAVAGACVRVEGELRPGGTVAASRVETESADKCNTSQAPEDLRFFGTVQTLSSRPVGTWIVSGRAVILNASTSVDQNRGPIEVGVCVEVQGVVNADGSITARRIETRSGLGGCAAAPEMGRERAEVEFRGTVQSKTATGGGQTELLVAGRRVLVRTSTEVWPGLNSISQGDCVEVEGELQSDGVVFAGEVKRLGGRVCKHSPKEEEDELKLVGRVTGLPGLGLIGAWQVGGRIVQVTLSTRIDAEGRIQQGSCVEVRGELTGITVRAERIRERSPAHCEDDREKLVFFGTIEAAAQGGGIGEWRIGGRTVQVTSATAFESKHGPFALGACVEVEGSLGVGGVVRAAKIEVKTRSGMCILPGGVVGAGNMANFSISAGQIVTVFGLHIGPAANFPLAVQADGRISSRLGNTRVLFDGVAGTMLFASSGQLNVIVPCTVAGKSKVKVQVESNGAWSNIEELTVAAASPSLFTLEATGQGPGAIFNFDATTGYSVNSATNPAARGSTVLAFGTGFGPTTTGCEDGTVAQAFRLPRLTLPVTATIGGKAATVSYAGGAPGLVNGVVQFNLVVGADVQPGPNTEVILAVGGRSTQSGVTMAVR